MARIRTIKPEFQNSQSMGRVSRDARLVFIELWPQCDDAGRIRANSRMLASVLFPYDEDAPALIDTWLSELEKEGCIVRYAHERDEYLQICHWDHQKIDHPQPSKLPPPLAKKRVKTKLTVRECSRVNGEASPNARAVSSTVSVPEGNGEDLDLTTFGLALTAACAAAARQGAEVIRLPTNRFEAQGEEVILFESHAIEFSELYPVVDIREQLRAMKGWLLHNRAKRKTRKGMMRFVNSWLADKQNKNGKGTFNGSTNRTNPHDAFLAGGLAALDKFKAA